MKKTDQVRGPMQSGFPVNSVEGDKRDLHDQNPSFTHCPEADHARSKDTLPLVFKEGVDTGDYIGRVVDTTEDLLSSPMGGQRRSATGERESPNSTLGINFKK